MNGKSIPTVTATDAAIDLIRKIKGKYGENLVFHQSGGCCDGSAPMCFETSDFMLGGNDLLLGELDGVPFYINRDQGERWGGTNLIIDAIPGNGGMFSLDNGTGQRFLTRSEVCAVGN
ncbi:hypothetical protein SAMN04515647_0099 [Cohaesibacter sp. ES.047]|uniref:DUF779 domain-containing protein n=1 Tax=Cohaesibacter sp. ES.047 TaxID=1798205 RepID=UPI000BB828E3|nr:DUF779 domain-containing protein [Cohaesibacter sp. ES.047]SNY89958.1 hypothetical protein SAMN04515647_0099 [Cohaesibacter sp. ES.047]